MIILTRPHKTSQDVSFQSVKNPKVSQKSPAMLTSDLLSPFSITPSSSSLADSRLLAEKEFSLQTFAIFSCLALRAWTLGHRKISEM